MNKTKKHYSEDTIKNLLEIAKEAKKSKVETLDQHLNNLFSLVQFSCLESIRNKVFDKKDYQNAADYKEAYSLCDAIEKKTIVENRNFSNLLTEKKLKAFTYPYYLDVKPSNYSEIEAQLKDVLGSTPYNIARQQLADLSKENIEEYSSYVSLTKPVRDRFFSSNKEQIQKIESMLTKQDVIIDLELIDVINKPAQEKVKENHNKHIKNKI